MVDANKRVDVPGVLQAFGNREKDLIRKIEERHGLE
jgi:hypothetical protein